MTPAEVRTVFLAALASIAPEADLSGIDPHADLRDQLDLDSMDILNLAVALHDRLGIDIPEADYAKLATLENALSYLAAAQPREAPGKS